MLLTIWAYQGISRPLGALAGSVELAASGRPVPVPTDAPMEVSQVVEQLNRMLEARMQAESAARRARDRYRSIIDEAVFGIYLSTVDGRFLHVNPALVSILGYDSAQELLAVDLRSLYRDASLVEGVVREQMERGAIEDLDVEWVRKDGRPVTLRMNGKVVQTDRGEPAFEVIVENVTERRRIEEIALYEQRMKTVGRLAGGVAHEFNNLFTVIGGNVQFVEEDLGPGHPLVRETREIAEAVERGAVLTRRLLAFAQRGIVQPTAQARHTSSSA